jgi:uncharacterized membrane protein YbhN (UPF0104 family)
VRAVSRPTLVRIAGIAISLACLAYVIAEAARVWDSVGPALLESDTLARLSLALAPIMIGYVAAALAWVVLLRSFGVRAAMLSGAGTYLAAQVGKYLPGNVGHYVGRVVLGVRVGHPASTVTLAMTVEFALLLVIAALLSLPMLGLAAARLTAAWNAQPSARLMALAACVAVIVVVLLAAAHLRPTLAHSLKQWARQLRVPVSSAGAAGRLAVSISLSLVAIGLASGSLFVLGDQHQGHVPDALWPVISLYSVAWIVGALTPGVPGGIGVREAILVDGLTPLWGASEAVAGALLFRVVTISADFIALGLGLAAMRVSDSPASERSSV